MFDLGPAAGDWRKSAQPQRHFDRRTSELNVTIRSAVGWRLQRPGQRLVSARCEAIQSAWRGLALSSR
jgi:hypothetical protein